MFYGRDWEGVGLEELGEKDRWLHRVVQHKEDQALAGLDEPLGIQARPSPCSLARTVRKSGTTPAVLGLPGGEGARGRRRVPLAAGGRIRTGLTALLAIPNYK